MAWINHRRVAIVIFPSLPTGMESSVQLVSETIRLSRSLARVNTQSISSVTTLRQRQDCYCDSMNTLGRDRSCPENQWYNVDPSKWLDYALSKLGLTERLIRCDSSSRAGIRPRNPMPADTEDIAGKVSQQQILDYSRSVHQ
jgi:hypothetical protein